MKEKTKEIISFSSKVVIILGIILVFINPLYWYVGLSLALFTSCLFSILNPPKQQEIKKTKPLSPKEKEILQGIGFLITMFLIGGLGLLLFAGIEAFGP